MSDMIKYVVECDTWNGVVALLIFCLTLCFISFLIYLIVMQCIKKYKDIHAKSSCNNVSFETELHR